LVWKRKLSRRLTALQTEVLDAYTQHAAEGTTDETGRMGCKNVAFSWSSTTAFEYSDLRIDRELVFNPGLNIVIGPTASGKSGYICFISEPTKFSGGR
jgi:hypothetical protein